MKLSGKGNTMKVPFWIEFSIILSLAIVATMFVACAAIGIKKPPSVCDSTEPGASVLCDIAGKNDFHLETAGNILMVVNLRAIKQGLYTAQDAINVLGDVRYALGFDISAVDLKRLIFEYIDEYPELILASPFLGYLDTPEMLKPNDKKMILWWIDEQNKILN